jgi:hypothetical protein
VHAHLVGPSRLEDGLDARRPRKRFDHPPVGDGLAPGLHLDGELLAIARIPTVQRLDAPARIRGTPDHEGVVDAADVVGLERRAERHHRAIVLGHHQQPRGVLVDPVNDPGAELTPDATQIVHVGQERIDQRARLVTRRGMHHQPGGLVDHDEVCVLVHDGERNRLGLYVRRHGGGGQPGHALADLHLPRGDRRLAIHRHRTLADVPGQLRAGHPGDAACDVEIEARSGSVGIDGPGLPAGTVSSSLPSGWARRGVYQIRDFTCPLAFNITSTRARS